MSTPFLQDIAEHFAEHFPDSLYRYRFFFPNRRSGLFFRHYLRQALGSRAALLPELTTMTEYIRARLLLPDEDVNNDLLVTYILFRCFNQEIGDDDGVQSFGEFYHLGGLLLSDFNDIDKHLLNVEGVFRNVSDYQELSDDFEFLSDEQRDLLRTFFGSRAFDDPKSTYRQHFLRFWEALPSLYRNTRLALRDHGLYYEGMLLRDVAEGVESGEVSLVEDGRIPVVVGLNVLTPCEREIYRHMRDMGDALFYWDYASDLLAPDTLAGSSVRNSVEFAMPVVGSPYHIDFGSVPEASDQTVELVALPSTVAQTTYIGGLLQHPEIEAESRALRAAVVLPNERLLLPLLSNIPSAVTNLNVTMGYPAQELPTTAMLLRLLELKLMHRRRGGEWRGEEVREIIGFNPLYPIWGEDDFGEQVIALLKRDKYYFITSAALLDLVQTRLSPTELQLQLLQHLFRDIREGSELTQWLLEIAHYVMQHTVVAERAQTDDASAGEIGQAATDDTTVETGPDEETIFTGTGAVLPFVIDLLEQQSASQSRSSTSYDYEPAELYSYEVVHDLLVTLLRHARIPFKGEPLRGLQVMGILETRGLDFDTIIIPDAAENILPSRTRVRGVIPYAIRRGLGLPTYKWQEETRAYHFFRLISRARRIVATYDTRKTKSSGGEPSRYLMLLEHVYGRQVHKQTALFPIQAEPQHGDGFVPDPMIMEQYRRDLAEGRRRLSASALNKYMQCPRSYYYTRIVEIPELDPMEELISDSDLGTLIHNTIRSLYYPYEGEVLDRAYLQTLLEQSSKHIQPVLDQEYQRLFKRSATHLTGMNQISYRQAETMIRSIVSMDLECDQQIHYIGGEVEIKCDYTTPDGSTMPIRGFVDRVDYVVEGEQTVLRIIDYKTGRDRVHLNLSSATKPGVPLDQAALQLSLYALLFSYRSALDRLIVDRRYLPSFPPHYTVRPLIYKPKVRNDGVITLTSKREPLLDFEQIRKEYKEVLDEVLKEMADPSWNYPTRPRPSTCYYCPAAPICADASL